MTTDDDRPLELLLRPDPRRFATRTLRLSPGETLGFHPACWQDALVVVEWGELEVLCRDGDRHHFGAGAVLWLHGLPITLLRNPGPLDAGIIAVWRKSQARIR